ncbi:MAG TPA: hypothetical protein VEA80_11190 [Vitreimonas sp.]|uniref:hypothetical protein n=1 Tax=Vitreimonas sp. TaxID=3069702 RepID=UPI002D43C7C6|nr:hypothetical protein [Vitreimonas sp.]HYD88032.1 hypothetical protein [Vitreimonas sp.]
MNILPFILLVALVLCAIAAPVVFALRRRARVAAAVAATIGFGAQALYVSYLQSAALGPEQGALALLVGIPGVAIVTCLVSLLVIARITNPAKP